MVGRDFRQVRLVVEAGPFVEQNIRGTSVHLRRLHVAVRTPVAVKRTLRVVHVRGVGELRVSGIGPAKKRRVLGRNPLVGVAAGAVVQVGLIAGVLVIARVVGRGRVALRGSGGRFRVFPLAQRRETRARARGRSFVFWQDCWVFVEVFAGDFSAGAVVVAIPVSVRVAGVGYVVAAV